MMRYILIALLAGLLTAPALSQVDLNDALADDVVLRALVDELERNLDGLEIKDLEDPYFIEFGITDATYAWVSAEYGAPTGRNEGRYRSARVDVRVGSYELDNTNFRGSMWSGGGGASMPIDDDYNAIRQALWWLADRDYKSMVETFEQKKAFMKSKMIEDKPPDFSHEESVVCIEPRLQPSYDIDAFEQLACRVSSVFAEYPDIIDCGVSVSGSGGNEYMANTEGTRLRTAREFYAVSVMARLQAEDGMPLYDSFEVNVRTADELPDAETLIARSRKLAERLIELKNAPRLDELYVGPVLFEAPAAASLFHERYSDNFAGGQRPVGSSTSPNDFVNKLNRRILPRFMDVVDDPTLTEVAGKPALGHYRYDDQGVPAQRVQLVEGGRLKALLMSRNPSKEFRNSTGHGRGWGGGVSTGVQIVTADPGLPRDELTQELIEAALDEGLEYAIRIADLGSYSSMPLVMYKVYPDGREELIRGGQIADLDLKVFKRMLAAGDELHVINSAGRLQAETVAAPAMLFEELDIAKVDRDFDKPPILTNPYGR